jgi:hypothetical protein
VRPARARPAGWTAPAAPATARRAQRHGVSATGPAGRSAARRPRADAHGRIRGGARQRGPASACRVLAAKRQAMSMRQRCGEGSRPGLGRRGVAGERPARRRSRQCAVAGPASTGHRRSPGVQLPLIQPMADTAAICANGDVAATPPGGERSA